MVLWRDVGGGRRVELPAPPRPKVILGEAVGWGSVKRRGILGVLVVVEMVVLVGGCGGHWGEVVDERQVVAI